MAAAGAPEQPRATTRSRRSGSCAPPAAYCLRAAANSTFALSIALVLMYGALLASVPAVTSPERSQSESGDFLRVKRNDSLPLVRTSREKVRFAATNILRCLDSQGIPTSNFTVQSDRDCPPPAIGGSAACGSPPSRRFARHFFVGCLSQPSVQEWTRKHTSHSMTVSKCLVLCYDGGFSYASLTSGDTCHCLHSAVTSKSILAHGECSRPCSGNAAEACGGARGAGVYLLRSPDGGHDWSVWMNPPWQEAGSEHSTRIRHCLVDDATRACNATIEKKWDRSTPTPPAFERFLGCFTFGALPSDATEASAAANDSRPAADPHSCVTRCAQLGGYDYALFDVRRRCSCTNSLGVSRPFRYCGYPHGVGVYAARRTVTSGRKVRLRFDERPHSRKVALLAYFRSGSTFTSELLNRHPGALYLYEPDAAFGLSWDYGNASSSNYLHREYYRAFESYVACDVYRLPPRWLTLNTQWPSDLERCPRFNEYYECTKALGAEPCSPVFQAQCEAASIIAAKTIRVNSAFHTEDFVRRHSDVIVVHLMRDPRGILSSRKHLAVSVTESRVRHLCGRLRALRDLAANLNREGYATYNLQYEDVVDAPVDAARHAFDRFLRLNMSTSLAERLLVLTGSSRANESAAPKYPQSFEFGTRRRNSRSSLTKWKKTLSRFELTLVSRYCQTLLN